MSIDFSQVKTITIPEGSVKKITDSTGNILWKKGPSWHTVFEGNWSRTWDKNTKYEHIYICALSPTDKDNPKPTKLRITGSINNTFYNPVIDFTWTGENKETFELPTLPLAINKETTQIDQVIPPPIGHNIDILKCECSRWRYSAGEPYYEFIIDIRTETNMLDVFSTPGTHLKDYTVTFNITKVEQYY